MKSQAHIDYGLLFASKMSFRRELNDNEEWRVTDSLIRWDWWDEAPAVGDGGDDVVASTGAASEGKF